MRYLLGIDIGTSACKTALFGDSGEPVASAERAYDISYPHPGWAQQDPEDWWQAAAASIREVLALSSVSPSNIAGIGIAGQSWAAVPVDADGNVLAPTPIWTDTRSRAECDEMCALLPERVWFACSGNPVKPSYTMPKVLWMKKHLPQAYRKAAFILQSNGFIAYRLTNRISMDLSQGYGWSCFHMESGQWDRDLAREAGIDPRLLPPLLPCHGIVGGVTAQAARLTGLLQGTPVAAGGLDAACGTLGAGVLEHGQTQEQGGQAGGMSICLSSCLSDPLLILGRHVVPGRWLLQGGTTGGGGALKWLKEQCSPELDFAQMSELAGTAPPGSGGVVFLPYMNGERSPLWEPDAKGIFFGLSYASSRAHLIRSVMEGVAFSLRHNLETAQKADAACDVLRSIGGSAKSSVWTQIKADVTGHRIEATDGTNATTHGAAILAGIGTGVYTSFREAVSSVRILHTYEPNTENKALYTDLYHKYRSLADTLLPLMKTGSAHAEKEALL